MVLHNFAMILFKQKKKCQYFYFDFKQNNHFYFLLQIKFTGTQNSSVFIFTLFLDKILHLFFFSWNTFAQVGKSALWMISFLDRNLEVKKWRNRLDQIIKLCKGKPRKKPLASLFHWSTWDAVAVAVVATRHYKCVFCRFSFRGHLNCYVLCRSFPIMGIFFNTYRYTTVYCWPRDWMHAFDAIHRNVRRISTFL